VRIRLAIDYNPFLSDFRSNRPALHSVVRTEKASNDVLGRAGWLSPLKGTITTLYPLRGVRSQLPSSPTNAPSRYLPKSFPVYVASPGRRHVRAKRVVQHNGLGDRIGRLRLDARVEALTVIVVGGSRHPARTSDSPGQDGARSHRVHSQSPGACLSQAPIAGRWGLRRVRSISHIAACSYSA
jgi:hypothetical protein